MFRATSMLALLAWLFMAPLCAQPRTSSSPQTKGYTMAPEKYHRAVAYSHWQYGMHFLGVLWAAGTLIALLKFHVAPRLRTWFEAATRRRFFQAAMFVPALLLTIDVARLPLDSFSHWLDRHYDQSIQGWGSWLFDWSKNEAIEFAIAILLVWILYAVIRRSPRRWWFHFWLAAVPILVFLL